MNWQKVLSSLLIVILFIPLVFMGANVFFPKYDYYEYKRCVVEPRPIDATAEEIKAWDEANQKCQEESQKERQQWEESKRTYEGGKYIFIIVICLIASLAALYIPLKSSIKWGLFIGAVITAFIGTLTYFRTKSLIGFIILVILFIFTVIFINKQKNKGPKR